MTERSLALARTRAQTPLVFAITATVALLVFALCVGLGWLTGAVRDAVVDAVTGAAPSDRQTVLEIPVAGDPAAQSATVEAFLRTRFGGSLRVAAEPAGTGGTSRWTLTVDPEGLDPWSVVGIAADLGDLGVLAQGIAGLAPEGASTEGGLAATLDTVSASVAAVQAVSPVPFALIVIGGLIAVLQLSRLLGSARAPEVRLLRARGMDSRTGRRMTFAESAATTAAASAVGFLAAAGVVTAAGGAFLIALAATWLVPVLAFFPLVVTTAWGQDRAARGVGASERSGRRRSAVTGLSALLVVAAAAVFLWQLSGLRGDAVDLTGNVWSLIVMGVAPAAGLAAVATLALLLFAPVAALAARAAGVWRALSPALPARMAARHVSAFGVVVALLALAAGGASFAGAAVTTWGSASADTAVLIAGADVRASPKSGVVTAQAVREVADAARVQAAGAALLDSAEAGGAQLQVVAVSARSAGALLLPLPSAGVVPSRLAKALGPSQTVGQPLGAGARTVAITFAVTAGGGTTPSIPEVSTLGGQAWFMDSLGTPVRVMLDLDMVRDEASHVHEPLYPGWPTYRDLWTSGTLTATATLPEGSTEWSLVGFTVGFSGPVGSQMPTLEPRAIQTDAGVALPWPSEAPIVLDATTPVSTMTFGTASSVPAAVTQTLADELDLQQGGTFEVTLDRSRRVLSVEIADVVPAVPGTSSAAAILVPLEASTLAMLAGSGTAVVPTELWATGAGARAAVVDAIPDAAVVDAADTGSFAGALIVPWWIAVVATSLLAGVALIAAALGLAQQRATDVFVLRALGVTARRQRRSRTAEIAAVGFVAILVGGLLGIALAQTVVPTLTRAAVTGVPEVLSETVVLGFLPLVVTMVLFAVAVSTAAALGGRVIERQSVAGRVREAG